MKLQEGDFKTALVGFQKLARQGDPIAQYFLGMMYLFGQGVPKDYKQGLAWCHKAAEQGNVMAQTMLGSLYSNGEFVPKDEQQAVAWLRKAAEQGSAMAQSSLGFKYWYGQGVPKERQQAEAWFRKAAKQGHAAAQNMLGVLYSIGDVVPKDDQQSIAWFRKAAEQGDTKAQNMLGDMYFNGQGVSKDVQLAYFWWLLAGAKGDEYARKNRDIVERHLTPDQRASAQADARNWKPKAAAYSSGDLSGIIADNNGSNNDPSRQDSASAEADTTGSGFRVTRGAVVTNYHVINGCSRLRVNGTEAQVRGSDAWSDLAVLAVTLPGPSTTLRAQRVEVGEPVAVAGFPMRGLLSGFNMTTGNLSSLSGIGGDTRLVQITAPVQPGNSGGPMLDSAGNLLGVVVSKLDAIKAAKLTGDIPQNVNFAINANALRSFLDANGVDYDSARSDKPLMPTAIAEKARGFTVLVECWK